MARYVKVSTININGCNIKDKQDSIDATEFVIRHLEENIKQVLCDNPDLIVLPEVCDRPTGMTVEQIKEYYGERGDRVLDYLKTKARENNCYIAYPTVTNVDGNMFNCCKMIDRKGNVIGIYKKNYSMISEYTNYEVMCGEDAEIFECDFGRVSAMICFDLNFEDLRKRIKEKRPDIILFASNFYGGFMQRFLAYDTRSYVVSSLGYANQSGAITSPIGEIVAESTLYYKHVTRTINLDCEVVHLDFNIAKLRMLKEKYGTEVCIVESEKDLGVVLVTSETDKKSVKEMLEEFEIKTYDEYLEKSIQHRMTHVAK